MIQGCPDTPIPIRHQQTGALRLMTLEEHVKKTGGYVTCVCLTASNDCRRLGYHFILKLLELTKSVKLHISHDQILKWP